ncbi:divalent-cation tolerance protein CutA [Patescibacteria group bacterium]|nr:divalent-cation tolerance protein CutA [Patescibacteria group bacterium]
MNHIFIYITNPSKTVAKKIAKMLLQKKLIACANIFPIDSMYWWQGKIVEEREFTLLGKTADKYFPAIKREIKAIHPYKIPCITKIAAEPNQKYQKWLSGQLEKP